MNESIKEINRQLDKLNHRVQRLMSDLYRTQLKITNLQNRKSILVSRIQRKKDYE